MASSVLSTAWWNHERNRSVVAALREKFGPHATTRRRYERTRIFLRIIKTLRGGVAAWREEKPASRDDATAQRKAKKRN
jgi:hypothetical protein